MAYPKRAALRDALLFMQHGPLMTDDHVLRTATKFYNWANGISETGGQVTAVFDMEYSDGYGDGTSGVYTVNP